MEDSGNKELKAFLRIFAGSMTAFLAINAFREDHAGIGLLFAVASFGVVAWWIWKARKARK